MSAWRIASWERELARGTITCDVGDLPFDAAVALVDDFRVGEAVEVSLRPDGTTCTVTRIAPVEWRVPHAPPPSVDHEPVLAELRSQLPGRSLWLRGLDEDATLTIQLQPELDEPTRSIVLDGCAYVQLATELRQLVAVSAYALGDFVRECPDVAKSWPALDPTLTVFRFEPRRFGEPAGYAVAWGIRVTSASR